MADGPTEHVIHDYDLVPRMVTTWEEVKARLEAMEKFLKDVMREGVHYGPPFPGSTGKNMLYKAGAELLAEVYGYTVVPKIVHRIERWTAADGGPFFQYEFEADVISKRTGIVVGKGFGSCNSMENRYRWRQANRSCPDCGKEAIRKSKAEWGGGWYCATRDGGCNAKFPKDDPKIAEQEIGRVANDDIHTLVNTVLQVAKKRCFVAAVITVTQSSMLFESGEDADEDDAPAGDTKRRNPNGNGTPRGGSKTHPKSNGGGDKPPDERHPHKVVIRGETHWTAGVDFKNLLRVWDGLRAYDTRFGKETGKTFMQKLLGVESSHDLNEDMAVKLIDALQGELDAAGPLPPAADGPGDPYDAGK